MKTSEQVHAEQVMGTEDRSELWLDDVNDASFFYCDIPPMPDFPCMSSSSSSSSTPVPVKATAGSSSTSTASSSSSAASWAVLKSDAEEDKSGKKSYDNNFQQTVEAPPPGALSSTASMEFQQPSDPIDDVDNCMDVMDNLSYIDHLLDNNDFFDPSSIFQQNDPIPEGFQQEHSQPQQGFEIETHPTAESRGDGEIRQAGPSEDLATVFLEWLKMNKETVSAEDLRRVKIKKSTIECAARRLGGGREAMKQLLKLILEWVQTNHLQRRRVKESTAVSNNNNTLAPYRLQDPYFQNPNQNPPDQIPPSDLNPCFSQAAWISRPPYTQDPPAISNGFSPAVGYMSDPFGNGAQTMHPQNPYQENYHVMDCVQTWNQQPQPQFPVMPHYGSFPDNGFGGVPQQPPSFPVYDNQYPYQYPLQPGQGNERLARLGSSATKEARKKRMARQRRLASHHRNNHHHNSNNSQVPNPNQNAELQARMGSDNGGGLTGPGNWMYWHSVAGSGVTANQPMVSAEHAAVMPAVDRQQALAMNYQRQPPPSDRRQVITSWKPEKNLRFLLQKVLKQSDVGNLGRIVLPKKEAETHLPELEARDGIAIAMEDIGTSRVWNMRYRFWPNNKSRMYLLENTGEFVRANGLQEGDFIVIYSDVKCGKYLIRGVKVRQSGTTKSETKRSGKAQRNQRPNSPSANRNTPIANDPSSSSPNAQTLN